MNGVVEEVCVEGLSRQSVQDHPNDARAQWKRVVRTLL